jgi:hypothetical protein
VILRDPIPTDVDRYVHWQTHGEWRMYDAPWEGMRTSMTPEEEETFRDTYALFSPGKYRFTAAATSASHSWRSTAVLVTTTLNVRR